RSEDCAPELQGAIRKLRTPDVTEKSVNPIEPVRGDRPAYVRHPTMLEDAREDGVGVASGVELFDVEFPEQPSNCSRKLRQDIEPTMPPRVKPRRRLRRRVESVARARLLGRRRGRGARSRGCASRESSPAVLHARWREGRRGPCPNR